MNGALRKKNVWILSKQITIHSKPQNTTILELHLLRIFCSCFFWFIQKLHYSKYEWKLMARYVWLRWRERETGSIKSGIFRCDKCRWKNTLWACKVKVLFLFHFLSFKFILFVRWVCLYLTYIVLLIGFDNGATTDHVPFHLKEGKRMFANKNEEKIHLYIFNSKLIIHQIDTTTIIICRSNKNFLVKMLSKKIRLHE